MQSQYKEPKYIAPYLGIDSHDVPEVGDLVARYKTVGIVTDIDECEKGGAVQIIWSDSSDFEWHGNPSWTHPETCCLVSRRENKQNIL